MPRSQLRILLQEHTRAEKTELTGQVVSQVYLLPYDTNGEIMPCVHVAVNMQTGVQIISSVPIAANNLVLQHVGLGSPVVLRRSRTGRVEVVGLDKRTPGTIYNYQFTVSTGSLTSGNVSGFIPRVLTYIELTSFTSIGYGQTPFGATALFSPSSAFIMFT